MKIEISTKTLIWIISVFVLLLAGSITYIAYKSNKEKAIIAALQNDKQELYKYASEAGDTIMVQRQRIATLKELRAADLLNIKELKEKNISQASIIIHLDSEVERYKLAAQYVQHDTIELRDTIYPTGFLKVPKRFKYEDKWTLMNGVVTLDKLVVDSLLIQDKTSIILGYSNKYFKELEPVGVVS